MSKALVKSTVNAVTKESLSEGLENWEPSSKSDSVRMLHFISLITKMAQSLKQKSYSFLSENYPDALNAVDAASGLEVTKVCPKIKVYRSSKETEALEEAIEVKLLELNQLKQDLKDAYKKNGLSHEVDEQTYYKTK